MRIKFTKIRLLPLFFPCGALYLRARGGNFIIPPSDKFFEGVLLF